MWQIFYYQVKVSFGSLLWWVFGFFTFFSALIINGMGDSTPRNAFFSQNLAALQAGLFLSWGLLGFYLPYLVAQTVNETRNGGLLAWWISSGCPPWQVALAQSLAILVPLGLYLLLVISPLVLFLLRLEVGIPWLLLIQHHILFLASGELLILFTMMVASFSGPLLSYLVGAGAWGVSVGVGHWLPSWLGHLPTFPRIILGWVWYSLPRFELFDRPMSLIYLWPPLPLKTMISLLGYASVYGILLLLACECTYRVTYGR